MLQKLFRKFSFTIKGIYFALRHDNSFRGQFCFGGLILALVIYYFHPLSQLELLFAVLAWLLVLITELQNTAFETALDHLHPEQHSAVGHSKDMASGSVLLAGLFALFVFLVILYNHLLPSLSAIF